MELEIILTEYFGKIKNREENLLVIFFHSFYIITILRAREYSNDVFRTDGICIMLVCYHMCIKLIFTIASLIIIINKK